MEEFILNAITKYYKTLQTLGFIDKSDEKKLFMVSTIYDMYKAFYPFFQQNVKDIEALNRWVDCITSNSCLFSKDVPTFGYRDGISDSLITIEEGDVIATTNGAVMTSTRRVTQNFTDFSISTDIQPDQYLVGYDVSDNKEMAVNINDLGIFWN